MTVEPKRRALTIAICATIATVGFALSLCAMANTIGQSIGNGPTNEGVTYTFDTYRCVGNGNQYQRCGWLGTVSDDGVVEQDGVEFRDAVPPEVTPGYQVRALWSYRDPLNAWSIEGSRAWLNTLASAATSFVLMALTLIASIYWWRRYAHERNLSNAASSKPGPPQPDNSAKGRKKELSDVQQ